MIYNAYITKRRVRVNGICGTVNIPYGTILPVEGEYILYENKRLCAVSSDTAIRYFWGYNPAEPEAEIERQKAAAELLDTAPPDDGDSLLKPENLWIRYGHMKEMLGGAYIWTWNADTADMPLTRLHYLLDCVQTGHQPVL